MYEILLYDKVARKKLLKLSGLNGTGKEMAGPIFILIEQSSIVYPGQHNKNLPITYRFT